MKKKINRVTHTLTKLRGRNEKALVCFLTAGFPKLNATVPLVRAIEKGGADIIEIGMPFSDPLAEGPIIQNSSYTAIQNGITLDTIFSQIRRIRKQSDIPLILMGYVNPVLRYGAQKFFSTAAKAGVDGIILPELPLEETAIFQSMMQDVGLVDIILVSPTTPAKRMKEIDQASSGFLYCVSTTGVTGSKHLAPTSQYLRTVQAAVKKNPVLVGFGIKTPGDAKRMSKYSDGIIVGSALIQKISQMYSLPAVESFVQTLKKSVKSR